MNFDFLKDLQGLSRFYESCKDAEEHVKIKPYISMFASRRSAEILTNFIYLKAHSAKMEGLNLADMLSDVTVRNYINNRSVTDAFDHIRKSGNKAVHGDDQQTPENAIAALRDLHYVAGEITRKIGLIDQYPSFDPNIAEYPNATLHEISDLKEIAKEMFLAYVNEFHEQIEKDQYENSTFEYAVEGTVEMHEYIEFNSKPKYESTIKYLQDYFYHLTMLSMERSLENAHDLAYPVKIKTVLTINGVQKYFSEKLEHFIDGLLTKLPTADHFVIDSYCEGNLREYFENNDEESIGLPKIKKDGLWNGAGMLDKMESLKRREKFTYKLAAFYPSSGEFKYEKIVDGREVDVLGSGSLDIIHKKLEEEWWSWSLNLVVNFNFNSHPDILNQLHETVKKHIPESEIGYCEGAWKDDGLGILVSGIQWNTHNLCEIQTFLDEINRTIEPIKSECKCAADGNWEIKDKFAVATWDWFEDGFKVVGNIY